MNQPAWQARFEKAYAAFLPLQAQYKSGRLSEDAFRRQLDRLMIMDEAGTYWMLGADSGRWRRHQDGVWQPADPPFQRKSHEQSPPKTRRAGRLGRWFAWGFAVIGLILSVGIFAFVAYDLGDAMRSLAVEGIAAPEEVPSVTQAEVLLGDEPAPQAPANTPLAAEPNDAPLPAEPDDASPPAANTSAGPVVELLVGNALAFADPPDYVAYANTDQQTSPPEMAIATTCQNCWRYNEWFTIAGESDYIEVASNIPVTAIGVQFWGDANDDWAEVLLDGEPIYQTSVQGEDGDWPGGAFVRYLSVSNLPLEQHTLRVRDIGKGPGGGVTLYFFGMGTTTP